MSRSSRAAEAISTFRTKGVVVDTGPLMLLYAGLVSERLVERFKRTQGFTAQDFRTLQVVLGQFQKRFTTPQVMAEVCNLAEPLVGSSLERFFTIVDVDLQETEEIYLSSESLSKTGWASSLGFADLSVMQVARSGRLLISNDARLCEWCNRLGVAAVNFNVLRAL